MMSIDVLPTQLFGFDCEVIDDILEAVKNEPYPKHKKDFPFVEQTKNSFLHKTYPVLSDYLQKCNDDLWAYLKIGEDESKLVTTQCWMNRTRKGVVKMCHTHPNSIISGILYLTDSEVPTIFQTRNFYKRGCIRIEKNYHDYYMNETVRGRTVMFPSTLAHFVPENTVKEHRITISWNTFLDGRIGSEKTLTTLAVKVL